MTERLNDKDYSDFETSLRLCVDSQERLLAKEGLFIENMYERHEKYHREIHVSPAQLRWLLDIAEKLTT